MHVFLCDSPYNRMGDFVRLEGRAAGVPRRVVNIFDCDLRGSDRWQSNPVLEGIKIN